MYENVREQWPVSVRLEDFESGAFELPAGGLFVVRDDYVVPASMIERKPLPICYDALEELPPAATPPPLQYSWLSEFIYPDETPIPSPGFADLGYNRTFRSGFQNTMRRMVDKARRIFSPTNTRN